MNDYEFIEQVKLGVEANFERSGEVSTVLVVLDRHEGKEDTIRAAVIGQMQAKQLGDVVEDCRKKYPAVALVMEGFTVKIPPAADIDVMPWEHPARKESLIVTVYQGESTSIITSVIVRPKGRDPFLSPWETEDVKSARKWGATPEEDSKHG